MSQGDGDGADTNLMIPYDNETWDAIQNLLCREWFERLWVQQDVGITGI